MRIHYNNKINTLFNFFSIYSAFMANLTAVSEMMRPDLYKFRMDVSIETIPSDAQVWMTESI